MQAVMDLKGLHDLHLAGKPEGAVHDPATCHLCAASNGGANDHKPEGGAVSDEDKTFTEAELQAAVAAAVTPLQTRLNELEAGQAAEDVKAQIAAATSPLETQVADLQAQLDAKTVEWQAEKDRADGIVAYLDAVKTEGEAQAALEARKTERREKAKEVAGVKDDFLDANIERFAAMSDEDWQTTLDGWAALRSNSGGGSGDGQPPRQTAMHASRDDNGSGAGSLLRDVIGARRSKTADLGSLTR